jgi:hypothetical protein
LGEFASDLSKQAKRKTRKNKNVQPTKYRKLHVSLVEYPHSGISIQVASDLLLRNPEIRILELWTRYKLYRLPLRLYRL